MQRNATHLIQISPQLFVRLAQYELQHTATHCNTNTTHLIQNRPQLFAQCDLQTPATHCNTILQHTATHLIQNRPQLLSCLARCEVPHTATHCNTLQHTATHCNTLQYTTATQCNTSDTKQTPSLTAPSAFSLVSPSLSGDLIRSSLFRRL